MAQHTLKRCQQMLAFLNWNSLETVSIHRWQTMRQWKKHRVLPLVGVPAFLNVCVLPLLSSLSCCCKVMEALYVLKTFAVRPGMRELRCLFSKFVYRKKKKINKKVRAKRTQRLTKLLIAPTRWHCDITATVTHAFSAVTNRTYEILVLPSLLSLSTAGRFKKITTPFLWVL